MAAQTGIGDLIVAPIIGDEGPLGAIEVYRRDRHAFDDIDAAVLGGLADQAAIAITNARLIEELERSQASVARRADTERALRDITARIAALREPEVILERVVDEAMRLLGTDGAHLTRMGEDGTYLVPVVVAGATDPEMQAWLLDLRFPIGGGINGLAAELGEPVWTSDYIADSRIPHEGNDDEVADRMGLRAMAAAPLAGARRRGHRHARDLVRDAARVRAGGARPAPGPRRPGCHRHHELDPADPADRVGGPLPDARLLVAGHGLRDRRRGPLHVPQRPGQRVARLGHRDARSAAISWSSWRPGWEPEAAASYAALVAEPGHRPHGTDRLPRRQRHVDPARDQRRREHADGALSAIHGVARDVSERERLERELHESEASASASSSRPARTSSTAATPRAGSLFMAEGSEALFGWTPRPQSLGMTLRRLHRRGIARRGARQLRATEDRARCRPALPLHGQVPRRHDVPGRDHLGLGLGGRPVRRRPGHGPRRHPGRTPRAGAARVAGALPLPRRELAGRRLLDRRRGPLHVHVRIDGADDRLEARRGHRRAISP